MRCWVYAGHGDPFASWLGSFLGAEKIAWADVQEDVGRAGASGRKRELNMGSGGEAGHRLSF